MPSPRFNIKSFIINSSRRTCLPLSTQHLSQSWYVVHTLHVFAYCMSKRMTLICDFNSVEFEMTTEQLTCLWWQVFKTTDSPHGRVANSPCQDKGSSESTRHFLQQGCADRQEQLITMSTPCAHMLVFKCHLVNKKKHFSLEEGLFDFRAEVGKLQGDPGASWGP